VPSRPLKPCRSRLCQTLTRDPSGYCDEHRSEASNWNKRPAWKGSAASRGYDSRWRKLRLQILKRDDYLCQACLRAGRITEATEVDHRLNKASGGTDEPDNLEAICSPCHRAKTAREHRAAPPA